VHPIVAAAVILIVVAVAVISAAILGAAISILLVEVGSYSFNKEGEA
jgi:hypothetical protein